MKKTLAKKMKKHLKKDLKKIDVFDISIDHEIKSKTLKTGQLSISKTGLVTITVKGRLKPSAKKKGSL